ncbi:MAG: SH3 domain-containing protein [Spirochaetes bacterium]|nr:SH3 domain-containing protein [Spirochaetota bacterium]
MKKQVFLSFVIILTFFSCNKKTIEKIELKELEKDEITTEIKIITDSKFKNTNMLSWVEQLRLREKPDLNSDTIKVLKQGEELFSLNKSVSEKFKIEIRGKQIEGNWEYIKTKDEIAGWVFSGCLAKYKKYNNIRVYGIENELYIEDAAENEIIYKDDNVSMDEAPVITDVEIVNNKNFLIIYPDLGYPDSGFPVYIFNITDKKISGKFLDNEKKIGITADGYYIAFDSDIYSIMFNQITIFSFIEERIIFKETVTYCNYDNWDKGILRYKEPLGTEIKGKPKLTKFSEEYGQLYTWDNGIIKKEGVEVIIVQ